MRIPVAADLDSRDGTTTRGAKVVNAIVETKGDSAVIRKRPGISDLGLVKAGTAQLLVTWNGVKTVQADYLNTGTLSTIISAPVQTNLTPTVAGLQFQSQDTGNSAATQLLMIKNRTQAWKITRSGVSSSITLPATLGSYTYAITSLTRSGSTATATTTVTTGANIGESVTIAGANDGAYNGAKTVTAITNVDYVAPVVIPITITRNGTTATATTVSGNHNLVNGTTYTVSGANETAYNIAAAMTVTGGTTFTYTISKSTTSPATGTITCAAYGGSGGRKLGTYNGPANGIVTVTSPNHGLSTGAKIYGAFVPTGEVMFNGTNAITRIDADTFTCLSVFGYAYPGNPWGNSSVNFYVYPLSVSSLTYSGTTITVNTATPVYFDNSWYIYIAGATQTYYNYPTTFLAPTITGASQFTLTVANDLGDPNYPATGSPVVTIPAIPANYTLSYTVAGTPTTPDTGATKTVATTGGTVPGIAYVDGYFAIMDTNAVIYFSAIDDPTTWPALGFITAENENGKGVAIARSLNYLIAFKEWSTEFFYDTKTTAVTVGSPFAPVESGFTEIGCATGYSVANIHGSLFWMAQTRAEGRSVYMMSGLTQKKISTSGIDRILNEDSLATVYALGLELDGHPIYLLTLVGSNITLAFNLDSQIWTQWSSLTLGSSKSVTSITRIGVTATVTTSTPHGISDGDPVKISGANQAEYNGIFQASYVSPTVYEIEVNSSAVTPATGTILSYPFTESYFKFTKYADYQGTNLLLHESDGHLYSIESGLYQDAGLPINVFLRTDRLDGGDLKNKVLAEVDVIGEKISDKMMLRWSDDDCSTFSKYRRVDLSLKRPSLRRCGNFERRTIEGKHTGNYALRISALELEIGK